MKFAVRHLQPGQTGQITESLLEAESPAQLRQTLEGHGHIVLSIVHKRSNTSFAWGNSAFDVSWWCRELRTLLHAGMTIVEAIDTLQAQGGQGQRAHVHASLQHALRQGQSLSKAMQVSGAFPEVLVASIMASERTSTLVSALDDYLVHDEMMQRMKRQAVSAAIYPGVVMTLGLAISLFLLLYVVPRFSRMYEDIQGAASLPTQILLSISHAVQHGWIWILLGMMATVMWLMWAWKQGILQRLVIRMAGNISALQHQMDEYRLAKLYQSMALMFKGGYTLDEAMAMCERLDLGSGFTEKLRQARQTIVQGKPVAQALAQAGLTEAVTERLLSVGERTGGFDVVLQTIANRHAQNFATFMERAARIVEPVMLLLVALMVGGIVVLMYMPIFDIAASIG